MGTHNKKVLFISVIVTSGILLISLAVFGILYYLNRTSQDEILYSDVSVPVSIERDSEGVPFITADSTDDAYLALGYIHARDRLFLIEYYRAIARSTISRLLGEKALPLERLSAGLEIYVKAEAMLRELPEKHRKYLNSYAKGINLARNLGLHRKASQKEWDAADILAVLLLREWGNSFLCNTELIFPLPENLRYQPVSTQFPRELVSFYSPEQEKSLSEILFLKKLVADYIGYFNRGFAASITPSQSASGSAFSLFSMENSMSVYPTMYPVIIRIREHTMRVVSVSGLPFFFLR